jgi:hypothetical protein
MPDPDIICANFTISDAAKREFEVLRRAFNEHQPSDPAAVLVVAWGLYRLNNGTRFENVIVSFYGRSQYEENAHGIQTVSGVDLVFFTTPDYVWRFDGKVLDHADERGFFLRAP